ncbi:Fc.00g049020.m01.CDS01 [Cosmosporella sp. VM-42]
MDLVYSGATGTVIWLGPETESTTRAVQVLRQISTGAREKILRWVADQSFGDVFVADDAHLLVQNGLPPLSADDWLDLADVFTRSWFGRVWMIQEVALATNPTVLIGPHELLWDDIGYTAHVIGLSNALLGLFAVGMGIQNMALVIGVVHAINLQIMRERSRGEESYFFELTSSMDFSVGVSSVDASSLLLQLLISSTGFKATFPRDRVYALLGIANHLARIQGQSPLTLDVDYRSSDDEVITTLGLSLFRQTQSLHLLSHAGLASRSAESSMATWIPPFESANLPILGPNYTNLRLFNAHNFSPENPELTPGFTIDEELCRLHVQTISPHLGTIEELGETWPEMLKGNFTNCMKMLLHCGDIYSYTNEPIVEAFWRTLIMDHDMVQRPAPAHLAPCFAAWMKLITLGALYNNYASNPFLFDLFDSLEPLWVLANSRDSTNLLPNTSHMIPLLCSVGLLNNPDIPKISDSENQAMMEDLGKRAAPYESMTRLTMLTNRRLARTVRGYLCLVPHTAEVGDQVMIVAGCPVPLVLRRLKASEDCFEVVGDVYVHGVMFGEHMNEDTVWRGISLV